MLFHPNNNNSSDNSSDSYAERELGTPSVSVLRDPVKEHSEVLLHFAGQLCSLAHVFMLHKLKKRKVWDYDKEICWSSLNFMMLKVSKCSVKNKWNRKCQQITAPFQCSHSLFPQNLLSI